MSEDEFDAYMAKDTYGNFRLTDAIRVVPDFKPVEGYRMAESRNELSGEIIPVLAAAATREKLFDLFVDLAQGLGEIVEPILHTSHTMRMDASVNYEEMACDPRERIVVQSYLQEFKHLLMNDGCFGISLVSYGKPEVIQFDEHKLLSVVAPDLDPFKKVMQRYGLREKPKMHFIHEVEHLHSSDEEHLNELERLKIFLGEDSGLGAPDEPDDINDADWWKTDGPNPYNS